MGYRMILEKMPMIRTTCVIILAVLFSIVQICVCHSPQASTVSVHDSHMSANGHQIMGADIAKTQLSHSDHGVEKSPLKESCAHCDILTSSSLSSAPPIDFKIPLDPKLKDSGDKSIAYYPVPPITLKVYRDRHWREPLRPSPVSLKIRLLT